MENLAERLKESRKNVHLKQREVAELTEIGYSTYRRYEQGGRVPGFAEMVKLAKLFGVSLDYLAGLTEEPGIKK